MKVKRYTGTSLEKIRGVIVKELGENAVIISMKQNETSKPGVMGIGKTKTLNYEVTAAVDDPVDTNSVPVENGKADSPIREVIDSQKEHYRGIRSSMKILDEKLADVDDRLNEVVRQVSRGVSFAGASHLPPALANIHESWRTPLTERVSKLVKGGVNAATDEDWHEVLASMLKTAGGIMFRATPSCAPDVYLVTGPTGVGKTTTLAKLAAKCVLGEHLNVALISTDTFRVGAVDQLREYANLLGIELAVAFSGDELRTQLERFHDKDVVFIDTPGRSQFDKIGIQAVAENIKSLNELCVLLVVPAGVRAEDAESIVSGYSVLSPSAMIISKTDEASRCDGLTRLMELADIPVVYLTDGQRVPEDLHSASPGILASLIVSSVKCPEAVKIGDGANG